MTITIKYRSMLLAGLRTAIFTLPAAATAKPETPGDIVLEMTCRNEGAITVGHDFKAGFRVGEKTKSWDKGRLTITVAYDMYEGQAARESKHHYDYRLRADGDKWPGTLSGRGYVAQTFTALSCWRPADYWEELDK